MKNTHSSNLNECHVHEYQIGGRTIMLRSPDGTRVYKKILKRREYDFYRYVQEINISHPHYALNCFIPTCYRLIQEQASSENQAIKPTKTNDFIISLQILEWHNRIKRNKRNERQEKIKMFLEMQNFTSSYSKLNLVDIKIGKLPKRTQNILAIKTNVKVAGVLKTYQNGRTEFFDRLQTGSITIIDKVKSLLAWFFLDLKGKLKIQVVENVIHKLRSLYLTLRAFRGWKFDSASVCIFYDSANMDNKSRLTNTSGVKMVDFGRSNVNQMSDEPDQFVTNGLNNLIKYFSQILKNQNYFAENIKRYLQTIKGDRSESQSNQNQNMTIAFENL